MERKEIGRVSHYFGKPQVAAIVLTDDLKIGDTISIQGHTTDFEMVVESIHIEDDSLTEAAAGDNVGIKVPAKTPLRLRLGGKTFAVFHGHERGFQRAIRSLDVDYILHGHTHTARNEKIGGKRVINPGALYRAIPKTVATLDTMTDKVTFHEIDIH